MKTNKYFTILLLFIFLFCFKLFAQKDPVDFEFNFKFGFNRKDQTIFDSKSDTLIVTGIDTIMRFKLSLTKKEKQSIYEVLQKINFTSYSEEYNYQHPDSVKAFIVNPCQKYFFTLTWNDNSKLVEWNNCVQSKAKNEKHAALMSLERFIEKIIWSRNPLMDYHHDKMQFDPE